MNNEVAVDRVFSRRHPSVGGDEALALITQPDDFRGAGGLEDVLASPDLDLSKLGFYQPGFHIRFEWRRGEWVCGEAHPLDSIPKLFRGLYPHVIFSLRFKISL